jgi:hypothetical protein
MIKSVLLVFTLYHYSLMMQSYKLSINAKNPNSPHVVEHHIKCLLNRKVITFFLKRLKRKVITLVGSCNASCCIERLLMVLQLVMRCKKRVRFCLASVVGMHELSLSYLVKSMPCCLGYFPLCNYTCPFHGPSIGSLTLLPPHKTKYSIHTNCVSRKIFKIFQKEKDSFKKIKNRYCSFFQSYID